MTLTSVQLARYAELVRAGLAPRTATALADRVTDEDLTAAFATWRVVTKTTFYTAAANDVVLADSTAADVPVELGAMPFSGTAIRVKKIDSSSHHVVISPHTGQIDGASSYTLTIAQSAVEFVWNGSNWYVF